MKQIDESSPRRPQADPAMPDRSRWLGAVDDDRQGRLSGWAITREGDPCEVTVSVNGRTFRTTSDGPRPDLAAKGQARGQGGWRIAIGDALLPGENRVEVLLPDGTPLSGSPRTVMGAVVAGESPPAPVAHLGAVDTASGALLSGWALTATGDPCAVTIAIGDQAPVTILSDGLRPDLAAKGMSGGAGGWHLFLDGRLAPGSNPVTISLPCGTPLPGSPLAIEGPAGDMPTPRHVDNPTRTGPTVVELPQRPTAAMPSLAELDELSLDDLALAVASGRVRVAVPSLPAPVPPIEAEAAAPDTPAPARRPWLARLLRR